MNPKISIIMPNYNSIDYLTSTIKSVLNQNFKSWELLIIDDNSNLKTKKLLRTFKKYKKIKIFFLKKNRGTAYCRNFAIKKSKGNYLAFLDSDDIWNKNKLNLQYKFMTKNSHKFSYTCYKTFGVKINYITPPLKYDFNKFIHNTSIATSSMMILKTITSGVKFTNTKICEDYFFKCKILKKTDAFCLNKFLLKYRIRPDSMQSNSIKNFFWIWKINHYYNKLSFLKNLNSLFFICLNSIKKYGLKNINF